MSFGIPVRNGLGVGLLASTSLATRNKGFSPASLFTAGESGYWLDPSDFSTMWQDHQGVTPVTATGQTCGLILDKRIGTRTQVFDDANVTFSGTAGYAERISPGVYTCCRDASGLGSVFFGGLTAGKAYLVSVDISAYSGGISGTFTIRADFFNTLNAAIRPNVTAAGTYTFYYLATGTSFRIAQGSPGTGATISNVSILEVPGNHFLQSSLSNRPIVQTDGTNNYLAFDGTDDWLQSAATINPGAVDKVQVFAGVRKLSDAAVGVLIESSATLASNNGTFQVLAPATAGAPTYGFTSRGTSNGAATYNNAAVAAPITSVLTGLGDISAPSSILRVNGSQVAINTASSQGTGDYLTYTHFIGRRAGTSLPFNGRLYQLIARYGANLTADQIAATETFVNSKTGAY